MEALLWRNNRGLLLDHGDHGICLHDLVPEPLDGEIFSLRGPRRMGAYRMLINGLMENGGDYAPRIGMAEAWMRQCGLYPGNEVPQAMREQLPFWFAFPEQDIELLLKTWKEDGLWASLWSLKFTEREMDWRSEWKLPLAALPGKSAGYVARKVPSSAFWSNLENCDEFFFRYPWWKQNLLLPRDEWDWRGAGDEVRDLVSAFADEECLRPVQAFLMSRAF